VGVGAGDQEDCVSVNKIEIYLPIIANLELHTLWRIPLHEMRLTILDAQHPSKTSKNQLLLSQISIKRKNHVPANRISLALQQIIRFADPLKTRVPIQQIKTL